MTKHDNVSQGEIMKATEFVKKFGWERAKREVALIGTIAVITGDRNWLSDLKRLVESRELVESIGGLPAAKAHLNSVAERCVNGGLEAVREQYKILKQAIADVEACQ